MKNRLVVALLILFSFASTVAEALELDRSKAYLTEITHVAVGYYENIGIQLPEGVYCNGHNSMILLKSNPLFDELYSLLLAAKVSGQKVHFGTVVGAQLHHKGYCLIDEAALGRVNIWATQ